MFNFALITDINAQKMNSSVSLQQSLVKEVASLFGNDDAMRKMLSLAKKLKKEDKAAHSEKTEELTAKEKKEVMNDLRQAFLELRLAKQGKIKLRSLDEVLNEI